MQKRGLSTVVITLIIILVSLVAVGIIWIVVRNVIQTGSEGVSLGQFSLSAKIKDVSIDNSSNNVSLTVRRNAGKGNLIGINFIFSSNTDTEVITQDVSLKELEEMKFIFHLDNISVSDLISVSIVPLIKQDEEEILGIILDKYNLGGSKESPSGQGCIPISNPCGTWVCGNVLNGTCGEISCGNCEIGYYCNATGRCVLNSSMNLCLPNTYYIDFLTGNDNNNGTCATSAWKHSIGDPNATGIPASITINPGTTILFRGGVNYRGNIVVRNNGNLGNPIIYDGDSWPGLEEIKAIIDGSELISTSWTRCLSQEDCEGNVNWQNMYYTALPDNIRNIFTPVYENDEFLWVSQEPNPDSWFDFDAMQEGDFIVVPLNSPTIKITRTSITDPRYFYQANSEYWVGAYVGVWRQPNVIEYVQVRSYNPSINTIYFDDIGGDLYTDRDERYFLLNHINLIDQQGEFYFDNISKRMYAWPYNNPNSDIFTISRRAVGIYASPRDNIIIEGFKVQKYYGGINEWNQGMGIVTSGSGANSSNIIVRNNKVTLLRSLAGSAAIQLAGNNMVAENNYVHYDQRNIGINCYGTNITVKNNAVNMTSRQGIWFMRVIYGMIINNTVTEIRGMHSNGISSYLRNRDILIANNRIFNCNSAFTWEADNDPSWYSNVTIYNNLIVGVTNGWDHDMVGVNIINNIFVKSPTNTQQSALSISGDEYVVLKNNVIDGGGNVGTLKPTWTVSNNIYTNLTWNQDSDYGWSLQSGEILEYNKSKIFADYLNGNYNLKAGSIAIDSGVNAIQYLPIDKFPNFDFYKDINGISRPQGSNWDIGTYEFV